VSSKHCSAFIHAVRKKPLESSASSEQRKMLRKLRFAHCIWGEEAKLPRREQPTLRYSNLCDRSVAATRLWLQTRQRGCRVLLFSVGRPDGPDPQVSAPALPHHRAHKSLGPITASPAFRGIQYFRMSGCLPVPAGSGCCGGNLESQQVLR